MSNTYHAECRGGVLRTVREFHIVWRVVTLWFGIVDSWVPSSGSRLAVATYSTYIAGVAPLSVICTRSTGVMHLSLMRVSSALVRSTAVVRHASKSLATLMSLLDMSRNLQNSSASICYRLDSSSSAYVTQCHQMVLQLHQQL